MKNIINNLNDDLELLNRKYLDYVFHAEHAIGLCKIAYVDLKKIVVESGFEDKDEEITFFKTIKPLVTSKLIFYRKLLKVISRRPGFNKVLQKEYLIKETHKLQYFFEENLTFYEYYRRKRTTYDDIYFRRSNVEVVINNDSYRYLVDPEFSTIHDGTIAHLMAYEQLEKYLDNEIHKLDSEINPEVKKQVPGNYGWTDKKVYLAELAYALVELGVINNGKIGLAEMATILAGSTPIDPRELYRAFQDIQMRKKNRTVFLDKLKEALINKINKSEL